MCMFMFMSIYRLWVLLVQFIIMPIFFGGEWSTVTVGVFSVLYIYICIESHFF